MTSNFGGTIRRFFVELGFHLMKLLTKLVMPSILASLCLFVAPATAQQTDTRAGKGKHSDQGNAPTKADIASLQKKANEAQARIHGSHNGDELQLIKAVGTGNVAVAKKILIKNGFTTKDLENAKISLRQPGRGAGKGYARSNNPGSWGSGYDTGWDAPAWYNLPANARINWIQIKCCPLEMEIDVKG